MKTNIPKPKLYVLFILFGIISVVVFAQEKKPDITKQNDELAKKRAKEVIAEARKAINSKIDASQLKNFYLSFEGTANYYKEMPEKHQFSITMPDKINHTFSTEWEYGKGFRTLKLNRNISSIQEAWISSSGSGSRSDYKKSENPDDKNLKYLKLETSLVLLPIILDFAFIPVEFRYAGVAESESGKADVLETVLPDNIIYKLLFDQKSRWLVMMVKTFIDEGKPTDRKFYFSEYREDSGLIIPHKTIMTGISSRGTNIFVESNLKVFKINPEFKPDTFEIKDK